MKARRNFIKTATAGITALTSAPLVAGERWLQPTAPHQQSSVQDALRFITIEDAEIIKLKFDKKTPRTWNAIKESGGSYPSTTFLKITTNEGITGYAVTKGSDKDVLSFIKKIKGLNLMNTEQVWHHMFFHNRKPVAKGKEIHAIGSVDLCVWDIVGKALGLPVHKVLGTFREQIPVYAAGGYYAEGKGIPELVKEMEGYVAEGYKVVKMKIGYLDAKADAERTRAVVNALGDSARVMVDANNGYASAYEAIRYGRMVEDLDLYWFEEPVAPDDWRGNAEVRKELDIPVVAGENEYTRWGARDLVENHSCDIINIDTIKGGGLTEMHKIAALCSAYHIPVAPHGFAHMNVHAVASISNALILETYPAKARDFNPALTAFPIKDGHIAAPSEPGLGMDPDATLVKKYKV
ncbi:mandelate racemase/muconate lactonizing enzyme family protein [Tunicatimonas pelagia]|uniref:mandelate racemase/muconate lactonizing enzyme family protein n=1 Tax=Tunicatimonas pelagia TaxID=931531 RepID=UPI00266700E6|nr:mandelate racemase/muconate lactonizing enzyme family protein [Tunicatimonas pelagia]WKN41901.1 mandelate racemase/muconate lactonizing enzyme family protein [Tunicatimonas pelagia]